MQYPTLNREKELWRNGFRFVVGIDEAGRGPLAGPVVAAAVLMQTKSMRSFAYVRDSKQLSAKQREQLQ